MQKFQHWNNPKRSVQVGDVVLLQDSEWLLCSWPLAVVEQVHPGEDGLVRVATLRTSKGLYKQSVTRLVPLLDQEKTAPKDLSTRDCLQTLHLHVNAVISCLSCPYLIVSRASISCYIYVVGTPHASQSFTSFCN